MDETIFLVGVVRPQTAAFEVEKMTDEGTLGTQTMDLMERLDAVLGNQHRHALQGAKRQTTAQQHRQATGANV